MTTKLTSRFGIKVDKSKANKHFPMLIYLYPKNSLVKKHRKYNAFTQRMYERSVEEYKV